MSRGHGYWNNDILFEAIRPFFNCNLAIGTPADPRKTKCRELGAQVRMGVAYESSAVERHRRGYGGGGCPPCPLMMPDLSAFAFGQEKARQNGWLSPKRELVAQDGARNRRREMGTDA